MYDYSKLNELAIEELRDVMGVCRHLIKKRGEETARNLLSGSKVMFKGSDGILTSGVILRKKRTRAIVIEDETNTRWDVPFSLLESAPETKPANNILTFPR